MAGPHRSTITIGGKKFHALSTTVGSEASYRTSRVIWVPLYRQIHGLDCEAAALQMALAHERIYVSQNRLLNATGIDRRMPTNDATGFHWGDPFTSVVGNPDGSELRMTGYGTYSPPIDRVARSELPSFTVGSGVLLSILITARSVALSTPITRAGRPKSWLSGSVASFT